MPTMKATVKTKAQLDREIAEFISESARPTPAGSMTARDAAKLRELWLKHVSLDAHAIDPDRLYDVVRRSVQVVKTGLKTGRPEASRALLTEMRNDLSEVGRIKKRRHT
jgi:molybdenum cofactor biosynthesis enzyme MoaA